MNELSREQSWKNKRKRSLYVEEGYAGFIFYRKSKTLRDSDEASDTQTVPPYDVDREHVEPAKDEAVDNEVSPLSKEQLERVIEVKSFVDQLKRELRAKEFDVSDDKLEEVCGELCKELRREVMADSCSYIQYLEASKEEEKLPPHPMDSELSESIRQLRQKIDLYEREVLEWSNLMESKKTASQEVIQDLESNLSVDWSCLGPEDEAKLATHLTQEHRGWLDHATSQRDDVEWEKRTEDDLRTVSSCIDRELKRIQTYCDIVLQKCAVDTSELMVGANQPSETPRTLFRALKDTH